MTQVCNSFSNKCHWQTTKRHCWWQAPLFSFAASLYYSNAMPQLLPHYSWLLGTSGWSWTGLQFYLIMTWNQDIESGVCAADEWHIYIRYVTASYCGSASQVSRTWWLYCVQLPSALCTWQHLWYTTVHVSVCLCSKESGQKLVPLISTWNCLPRVRILPSKWKWIFGGKRAKTDKVIVTWCWTKSDLPHMLITASTVFKEGQRCVWQLLS